MDTERIKRIFFLIERLADQRIDYEAIKSNEEERKTSTKLGKQAIKNNVLFFIFMAIFAGLVIGTALFLNNSGIWQAVIMILFAVVILPYAIIYFILALNCDIKQMKLNKLPIGWVSLMFTLLILIGAIVAIAVTILVLLV